MIIRDLILRIVVTFLLAYQGIAWFLAWQTTETNELATEKFENAYPLAMAIARDSSVWWFLSLGLAALLVINGIIGLNKYQQMDRKPLSWAFLGLNLIMAFLYVPFIL